MGCVVNASVVLPVGKSTGTHFIGGWVTPRSVGRVRKTSFFIFGNYGSDCGGGGGVVYLTTLFNTNILYLGWSINESV